MAPRALAALVALAFTCPALTAAQTPLTARKPAACKEAPAVAPLEGCAVRECDEDEYDEAEVQTGPVDGSGDFPKRLVEGRFSAVTYVCPKATSMADIARRTLASLRRSGYVVVYSGRMYHSDLPGFTVRKAQRWIQLVSEPFDDGTGYTVTSVDAVISEPMSPATPPPARRGRKTTR
jgi:hypothetical protein